MVTSPTLIRLSSELSKGVAQYWATRHNQAKKQVTGAHADHGARSAVTGGAQMDGFIKLFARIASESGASPATVFFHASMELPGYFRPTKEWDLLVVRNGTLVAAIEFKSQVGPSFGNNFNNRTEEAMGTALDLWTAYREGAFSTSPPPFVGYFFMLEDCPQSQRPVAVKEPHFAVFPEFRKASYVKRYEIFCRKLVRERHYTAAAFVTSDSVSGTKGTYLEPAPDLAVHLFATTLAAHVSAQNP